MGPAGEAFFSRRQTPTFIIDLVGSVARVESQRRAFTSTNKNGGVSLTKLAVLSLRRIAQNAPQAGLQGWEWVQPFDVLQCVAWFLHVLARPSISG